ncbi:MAG: TetR/AcrR family transcriptional regulator [Acidimicrobiia bacterium]|nr:TetR/AcrR family transcriptional regulator [Acidimicrobiia bacterium]
MTAIDPILMPDARANWSDAEVAVLEAVKTCCERWGVEKVTVDDIARQAGVSRATLYRLFPGGKEVVFDAHRVYELDQFFDVLLAHVDGADTLEELLVRAVTGSIRELRADEHIAIMLASEPGAVVSDLTVDGLPRIIRVASAYLVPLLDPFMPRDQSRALVDLLVRLVVSYFLAPSDLVDLTDRDETRAFLAPFIPTPDPQPTDFDPHLIQT